MNGEYSLKFPQNINYFGENGEAEVEKSSTAAVTRNQRVMAQARN